jgi:hypothetical protein
MTQVCILSGSVVRIWDVLERVLARHEMELSKADRTMRIVRVDPGAGALPIIGEAARVGQGGLLGARGGRARRCLPHCDYRRETWEARGWSGVGGGTW